MNFVSLSEAPQPLWNPASLPTKWEGLNLSTLFLDLTSYDPFDFMVPSARSNRVMHPIITTHWLHIQTRLLYAEFCAAIEASGLVPDERNFRVSAGIDHDSQQFQGNNIEWGSYSFTTKKHWPISRHSNSVQSPTNRHLAPHLWPGD